MTDVDGRPWYIKVIETLAAVVGVALIITGCMLILYGIAIAMGAIG